MSNINSDIESNTGSSATIANYNSITVVARSSIHIRSQQQRQFEQRQRVILFAVLIILSMICVCVSYLVSSVTKPTCSDRIIWMPNCNREEYLKSVQHEP